MGKHNSRMLLHFLMCPQCNFIHIIYSAVCYRVYIRNQVGGSSIPIRSLSDNQRRDLMGRCTEQPLDKV